MLFSIVTVCFNSESTIKSCLESVSTQNCEDYEHIIIDGASNDGTLDLISEHQHPKLRLFSEPDSGIYDAMNKGIKEAKGAYIMFLNSDDVLRDENTLRHLQNLILQERPNIVTAGINYTNAEGTIVSSWLPRRFSTMNLLLGWSVPHPGFVAKSDVFERLGNFDMNLKIAADFDLMLRFCLGSSGKVTVLKTAIVDMYNGGVSSTPVGIRQGFTDVRTALRKNNLEKIAYIYFLCRYASRVGRLVSAGLRKS